MENILCAKHNEIENDGMRDSSSCYYSRTRRRWRRLGEAKELRGGFNAHHSKSYSHRGCRGRYTTHFCTLGNTYILFYNILL